MITAIGSTAFPAAAEIGDKEFAEIAAILAEKRQFSLNAYKSSCMKRRIAIRLRATRCQDIQEYCSILRQNEQEQELLQKTLTIHVSQFFRNPSLFETLRDKIIPELYASADQRKGLNLLCLGCAGGEEPYSLAIILKEHFGRELRQIRTTISAIDIDNATLESARNGIYYQDRLKDLPGNLRERYFRPHGDRLKLTNGILEMVSFQLGDLANPNLSYSADMILCRNTLIYFSRPEQERILNLIADHLPTNGVLVLGKSETMVGTARRRFKAAFQIERIYRKLI